jgi:hypothetical protein
MLTLPKEGAAYPNAAPDKTIQVYLNFRLSPAKKVMPGMG